MLSVTYAQYHLQALFLNILRCVRTKRVLSPLYGVLTEVLLL
jgi:hypothetical protein